MSPVAVDRSFVTFAWIIIIGAIVLQSLTALGELLLGPVAILGRVVIEAVGSSPLFGVGGAVAVVAAFAVQLSRYWRSGTNPLRDESVRINQEGGSSRSSTGLRERDPVEETKRRYVEGELSELEFEERIEEALEDDDRQEECEIA